MASTVEGDQQTDYDFDGSEVIREVTASGEDVDYTRGLAKRLISRQQGNSTSYYHHDAIGSVVGLSDSSGASTDAYSYDAFGNELERTGTTDQPYGYVGNRHDPSTGLSDFHARTYDPKNGRFTSKDPVRGLKTKPQTLNPYPYGINGPFAHPDPSGLFGFGLLGSALGEIGFGDEGYKAGQGSVGFGQFVNSDNPLEQDAGFFASLGGASLCSKDYSSCDQYSTGYPSGSDEYYAYGAFGGASGVGFITNANSLEELGGPFEVYNVNAALPGGFFGISGQYAYDENGTKFFSVTPIGVGAGGGFSHYQTNTGTLQTDESNLDQYIDPTVQEDAASEEDTSEEQDTSQEEYS